MVRRLPVLSAPTEPPKPRWLWATTLALVVVTGWALGAVALVSLAGALGAPATGWGTGLRAVGLLGAWAAGWALAGRSSRGALPSPRWPTLLWAVALGTGFVGALALSGGVPPAVTGAVAGLLALSGAAGAAAGARGMAPRSAAH